MCINLLLILQHLLKELLNLFLRIAPIDELLGCQRSLNVLLDELKMNIDIVVLALMHSLLLQNPKDCQNVIVEMDEIVIRLDVFQELKQVVFADMLVLVHVEKAKHHLMVASEL